MHVPRLPSSPHLSAESSSALAPLPAGASPGTPEDAEGSFQTLRHPAEVQHQGVPAKPLPPSAAAATSDDKPTEQMRASSPRHVVRISPRTSPPPRASSPPLRDVGGVVYHRPPSQSHTPIFPSDSLVHRLQSFLPLATRPSTRQPGSHAGIATDAVKIVCNGPALDRFPLSVQGGLSASQVKRAHTPAYEPRVLGHEREPLAQTWLIANPSSKGEKSACVSSSLACFDVVSTERIKTPAVTFQTRDALGWQGFKRIERKDGSQPTGAPFERTDPKAALTGFLLEPSLSDASSILISKSAYKASNNCERARISRQRSCNSMRWGSTPLSAARSASVTTLPTPVQMAISDVNTLKQTAPLVVSSFKQAVHEWEAAIAPTADPFAYINAKLDRVMCSPLATQRPASYDNEAMRAHKASHEVVATEASSMAVIS